MKKILVFLAASVLMIGNAFAEIAWNGQTETAWTEGDGTSESPYIISSPANLAYLATQVNAGNSYSGKYFRQTEDFNMGYKVWTSIGGSSAATPAPTPAPTPFEGIYDGNSRYIRNLDNNHLFGLINNATIKDLTLQADTTVLATMVNETNGRCSINYCYNKGSKESKDCVCGGLVNTAKGESLTLIWCNNEGSISADCSGDTYYPYPAAGGLVGLSYAQELNIIRCNNTGDMSGSSLINAIGGLVGGVIEGVLSISECGSIGYIWGDLSGSNLGYEMGFGHLVGLVGDSASATILSSYAKGASYNYLVGECRGSVFAKGCYVIDDTPLGESTYFIPKASTYNCYYVNIVNIGSSDWESNFSWGPYSSYCFHSCTVDIMLGTYVSTGEIKSQAFLSRINGDEELFAMDLDNLNNGYPILKWQEGTRYAITATCDATRGTVKGGGEYGYGNEVKLTATPKSGCSFIGWSDGNTDNPRYVTVEGEATYIAQFTKSTYTIYVNQDCSSYIE